MVRLLLDTDALIWSAWDSDRLLPEARRLMARLPRDLNDLRAALIFDWLPIDHRHATLAGCLPHHHGDPWDRLIVAQALSDDLTILSVDPALPIYGARVEW